MYRFKAHEQELEKIRTRLKNQDVHKKTGPTHCMRNSDYPRMRKSLGIDALNRILEIDCKKKIVIVEPNVPMDVLAAALLEKGLMAPIVPEFKGITVGGAISGAAIESSSHRYGQFNDICIAYEILLGNGEIIRATKDEHADLFYGVAGAYGSLGIVTLVEIQLIDIKPWVQLITHRMINLEEGVQLISQSKADFIEGLLFDKSNLCIVEGRLMSDNDAQSIEKTISLKPWQPFYYHQIKQATDNCYKISLLDYLFRHDRGAFWMGAYGQHYNLFWRYYMENRWGFKKFFKPIKNEKYAKLKDPSPFFSLFFGSWMTSRKLYRMLHSQSEDWVQRHFLVQDYYIPKDKCTEFIETVNKEGNIFPLWLCPVKSTATPQLFSPHFQKEETLMIDIGVYGMPSRTISTSQLNRLLEQKADALGGRKMFYSYNNMTHEEFWKIYPRNIYEELCKKYHAEAWVPIDRKILDPTDLG